MLDLLERMRVRAERDRGDGDAAYFLALYLYGELLTKIITIAAIAAIDPERDKDRYAYTAQYELVRATGIGGWSHYLTQLLHGSASLTLHPAAVPVLRDLTQKIPASAVSWQRECLDQLADAASALGIDPSTIGKKSKTVLLVRTF
jgi:hypothetical protein